jgi:hypothetical protein
VTTQKKTKTPQTESNWTPLTTFMASEGLVADDIVRLIDMGAPPRMETVNGMVWVHRPTLLDWRELAKIYGFKPLREVPAAKMESASAGSTN